MSEEETKVETVAEATAAEDTEMKDAIDAQPKKKGKKKWPIVVGVVVVVLIAAGAGFWVWHEQPSFCNAICHTPMDPYNATYDQELHATGIDKWGNTVEDTSSMLAVTHKAMNTTCMGCHVPTLSEQISEGINWVTGSYEVEDNATYGVVLGERSIDDLTEARGVKGEEFCLNGSCHANADGSAMTRADLIQKTSDLDFNPHVEQHGAVACSECHKAHRASVMYCTSCHSEADVPNGWLTVAQEKKLEQSAA